MGNVTRPDESDLEHGASLGACMRRVYLQLRASRLECAGPAAMVARWPRSVRAFAGALRRIGGPVWFRGDLGRPGDVAIYVVATIGPRGEVAFSSADMTAVAAFPEADLFNCDGRPLC